MKALSPKEKPWLHSGGFIGNKSTERSLDTLFFSPNHPAPPILELVVLQPVVAN